jgi:rhodanese-related sulfurtransferase
MKKSITPSAFQQVLNAEEANTSIDFINVCTPAEYKEKHIQGVRNVPLDKLEQHLNEFEQKKTIYIHCRSGKRGNKAVEKLTQLGIKATLVNVEGGLLAWVEHGYQTTSQTKRIPIIRQVLAIAVTLIIAFSAASLWINPLFSIGTLLVGLGLAIAGVTGWCGMALLLARMPWNK